MKEMVSFLLRIPPSSCRRKRTTHVVVLTKSSIVIAYNKCEKGDAMSYEIYVDQLFLVNFCMNLYIMLLMDKAALRTATRSRLVIGAFVGAVCYLLPLLVGGHIVVRLLLGYGVGCVLMLRIVFPFRSLRAFWRLFEKMLLYSFLLGGMMLCVLKLPVAAQLGLSTTWGIVCMGAVMTCILAVVWKQRQQSKLCRVILMNKQDKMTITALIDSGNSLMEPISGQPVSILNQSVFDSFYRNQNLRYRVIPYTSVGKRKGILPGYLLPELQIEVDGIIKHCTNVYVAVRNDVEEGGDEENAHQGESVKIILHPQLLEESKKTVVMTKEQKRGLKYDIKGSNTR